MPLLANGRRGDTPNVRALYEALCRYAGWLTRERRSRVVRTDLESLGNAIETTSDPRPHLAKLAEDVARLPSGDVRTMIRQIVVQLRHALEETKR